MAARTSRSRKSGVTASQLAKLALALPGVEAGSSYGTPAYRVQKKLFARLLEGNEAVVVKIDFDDREAFALRDPDTFYWTDHYEKYPMMCIRLDRVAREDLEELLANAWQREAGKRLREEYAAQRGAAAGRR